MKDILEEVLLLQPDWQSANSPEMQRRGVLVRSEAARWLRDRLPRLAVAASSAVDDLAVEGRDGTGRKTEIPWVRIHSKRRSPSATEGWYLVYLFSALGDYVYLSLNQGTTRWENGEFKARPVRELADRVQWARDQLSASWADRNDLVSDIVLDARSSPLGSGYERGNIAAIAYALDAIPDEDVLEEDLLFMTTALGQLYVTSDRALRIPGEPAPEIEDALTAVDRAAGRPVRRQGSRLSAAERQVVERHAVTVARSHLEKLGYLVKDVGALKSYDLEARRDDNLLFVEVKGTTSSGDEVILTRAEVELHQREYPRTCLMIVRGIHLDRSSSPPSASGGDLRVLHPWEVHNGSLTPIAYRYLVPRGGIEHHVVS